MSSTIGHAIPARGARIESDQHVGPTALDDNFMFGGGIAVSGTHTIANLNERIAELLVKDVPHRLTKGDPNLWGAAAADEARDRLGWLTLPATSRHLISDLASVREELRAEGLDHVVLAGMGGSSLAPEVMARTLGVDLTVLDTTDPAQVRSALSQRLEHTVVVVSSKSGGTVETDSHRRAYWQALRDTGLSDDEVARRFIIVTDPGSPLDLIGKQLGVREIFLADPRVGGRYSALSAFGLVPAALAGGNMTELLEDAARLGTTLGSDGPALRLGVALAVAAQAGRDKLVIAEDGTGMVGLGDWVEQLIAESTGKDGKGILPVVVERPDHVADPGERGSDVLLTTVGGALKLGHTGVIPSAAIQPDLTVNGPLGAQFLTWEYATAIASILLGVNPFDQPNVTESKRNTATILESGKLPGGEPFLRTGHLELYGDSTLFNDVRSVSGAVASLIGAVPERGYLALMAYLDRFGNSAAAQLRALVARRTQHAVTFGWGPRFLHSTGQYHKGGPATGGFLQITGAVTHDLSVPDKPYSFGELQAAQAAGDRVALSSRNLPLLRVHLTDRASGLDELMEALR